MVKIIEAAGGGGPALSDGDPDAITHAQAAGSGASADASRADHSHAMEAATAAAPALSDVDPDAITHSQAAAAGTSGDTSRADHAHAMEAAPASIALSDADPDAITHSQAAGAGASGDASRADHAHAMEARPLGVIWVQPFAFEGTSITLNDDLINYARLLNDNATDVTTMFFTFVVPSNFVALSRAVIVLAANGVGGNFRYEVQTDTGGNGQSLFTHSGGVAEATLDLGSVDVRNDLNIAGALTDLAAGDVVGVELKRHGDDALDTVGGLTLLGLLIEYTT